MFFATPWTVAHHAPMSVRFPRQEHWSGLSFPSLGDLAKPGFEPEPLHCQANYLPLNYLGAQDDSEAI